MKYLPISALGLLLALLAPFGPSQAASGDDLVKHFVPDDVTAVLSGIDAATRANLCQPSLGDLVTLESLTPEKAIQGYSSQMHDKVDLGQTLNGFVVGLSELATGAVVSGDAKQKELYVKTLAKWATAGAYLDTVDCSTSDCGGEWKSKRGTELAPIKDYQTVEENLIPIALTYYGHFADFEPEALAAEHEAIAAWLHVFETRLASQGRLPSPALSLGFGYNWQTWGYPTFDLLKGRNADFETRLKLLRKGIDQALLADGALKDRTTRGSRALWYHVAGLGETFFALEMLRANGDDAYAEMQPRLEKAVKIFLDAHEDFDKPGLSSIYKWAKAGFHSPGDAKHQMFIRMDGDLGDYTSWMFIYLKRYPDGANAGRIRALVDGFKLLPRNDWPFGMNYGCLYQLGDPDLVKRQVGQSKLQPDAVDRLLALLDHPEDRPTPKSMSVGEIAVHLNANNKDPLSDDFLLLLTGGKLDGPVLPRLSFEIMADYTSKTKKPKDLHLLRLKVNTETLRSDAARAADFSDCGELAGQPGQFRLHFGIEGLVNDCVLMHLPEADADTWRSVAANLPQLVHLAAQQGDALAARLEPLFKGKLPKDETAAVVASIDPSNIPPTVPLVGAHLLLKVDDESDNFQQFQATVIGARMNGKPTPGLQFYIMTDYSSSKKSPKTLNLLRLSIEQSTLRDPESRAANFTSCGELAEQNGQFRMHYGMEAERNDCLMAMMGPNDAMKWLAVYSQLPDLIRDAAAAGSAEAKLLVPLFDKLVPTQKGK